MLLIWVIGILIGKVMQGRLSLALPLIKSFTTAFTIIMRCPVKGLTGCCVQDVVMQGWFALASA